MLVIFVSVIREVFRETSERRLWEPRGKKTDVKDWMINSDKSEVSSWENRTEKYLLDFGTGSEYDLSIRKSRSISLKKI